LGSSTVTYNLPQKPQTCALNDVQIQIGAYMILAKRQPKLKKGFMTTFDKFNFLAQLLIKPFK
jgi:hypothetical protein